MRIAVLCLGFAMAACGQPAANLYPEGARDTFAQSCPTGVKECDCAWDTITRVMTHAEYEVALAKFKESGIMDRRLVIASVDCGA